MVVGLTSTNGFTTTGTTKINTNINLPITHYLLSNTALLSATQSGGIITVTEKRLAQWQCQACLF